MSEQQGLWYEISLSNRQVLAAFLILLACIVGAFLSGVWVGREAVGEAPMLVADGDLPEAGDSFEFFGDGPADGEAASKAPTEVVQPVRSERRPADSPPVVTRRTEQDRTAQGAASAPPEAAPQLSADDLIIQVFSSADQEQARSVLTRLRGGGFEAFLSPVAVDGRTMFRVRVGPFEARPEAERIAARVKREQRLDTWITSAAN